MPLNNAAAGFIGASVTLVLVIIFMILIVILVRQCLAFMSKRNAIRDQLERQRQVREQIRERRGSVSEPVPATFDWHHDIRIEGTPPPSYGEAKNLPAIEGEASSEERNDEQTSGEKGKENKEMENDKDGAVIMMDEVDVKKSSNGTRVSLQATASPRVTETETGPGESDPQAQTFTTNYTEFNSAQAGVWQV